jgi:hypothetical protein
MTVWIAFLVGLIVGANLAVLIIGLCMMARDQEVKAASFKILDLKICLDCDEVFSHDACPACGTDAWVWLSSWLVPMRRRDSVEKSEAIPRLLHSV